MTDLEITKIEHHWSKANDRWLFIQYDKNDKIVGLNFMQGEEYDLFIKDWCKPDHGLFEFYQYMLMNYEVERKSITKIDFINKAIWTYITAERIIEDFVGDFFNK